MKTFEQRREDLLRATVFDAFAKRGSDDFKRACERVLDGWFAFPLVENLTALRQVSELRAEAQRDAHEDTVEMEA